MNTRTYKCRWCGQSYSGDWNYDCCGEKCFREWEAASPEKVRQVLEETEAARAAVNKGCGEPLLKFVSAMWWLLLAAVAIMCIVKFAQMIFVKS